MIETVMYYICCFGYDLAFKIERYFDNRCRVYEAKKWKGKSK